MFRVRLKSDHKIDASGGFLMTKFDSSVLGTGSYVTGISNKLESSSNGFHLLMFDPSQSKLYYLQPNFSDLDVQAIELYQNIDYIRESAFLGTVTGSISGHS